MDVATVVVDNVGADVVGDVVENDCYCYYYFDDDVDYNDVWFDDNAADDDDAVAVVVVVVATVDGVVDAVDVHVLM